MGFGDRVKKVLDARGLKQVDLCRMAEIKSGLLSPYMTNPDKDPKLSTACKIALALDVSLDYLGGLIDDPRPVKSDERAGPSFSDPRQRDINEAFESVSEDGRQVMWTNSVMARTTFPERDERDAVQKDVM